MPNKFEHFRDAAYLAQGRQCRRESSARWAEWQEKYHFFLHSRTAAYLRELCSQSSASRTQWQENFLFLAIVETQPIFENTVLKVVQGERNGKKKTFFLKKQPRKITTKTPERCPLSNPWSCNTLSGSEMRCVTTGKDQSSWCSC